MAQDPITIARAYYLAMGNKDIAALERYLDPNVQFSGPLAEMQGKQNVVEAAKRFCSAINQLTI